MPDLATLALVFAAVGATAGAAYAVCLRRPDPDKPHRQADRLAAMHRYPAGSPERQEFIDGFINGSRFIDSGADPTAIRWTYEFTISQLQKGWAEPRDVGWALAVQPHYDQAVGWPPLSSLETLESLIPMQTRSHDGP